MNIFYGLLLLILPFHRNNKLFYLIKECYVTARASYTFTTTSLAGQIQFVHSFGNASCIFSTNIIVQLVIELWSQRTKVWVLEQIHHY